MNLSPKEIEDMHHSVRKALKHDMGERRLKAIYKQLPDFNVTENATQNSISFILGIPKMDIPEVEVLALYAKKNAKCIIGQELQKAVKNSMKK